MGGINNVVGQIFGHGGVLDESGVSPWRSDNSPAHGAAGEQAIPPHGGLNPEAQNREELSSHSSAEPLEPTLSELSSDYAGAAGPSDHAGAAGPSDHAGAAGPSPANPDATHLEGQSPVSNKPSSALEQKQAQFKEALKKDTDNKLLTPQEKKIINDNGLEYEHHNGDVIYLKAGAKQESGTEINDSDYWYRTMPEGDFNKLNKSKNNGEMPRGDDFNGIVPNRDYARSYLTNKKDGKYTVEFHSPGLAQRMGEKRIQPKIEDGTLSYGLGDKGTRPPDSKSADGANPALKVFNEYASPKFNVVNAKIENRGFNPTDEQ